MYKLRTLSLFHPACKSVFLLLTCLLLVPTNGESSNMGGLNAKLQKEIFDESPVMIALNSAFPIDRTFSLPSQSKQQLNSAPDHAPPLETSRTQLASSTQTADCRDWNAKDWKRIQKFFGNLSRSKVFACINDGARADKPTPNGHTVLHYAARWGSAESMAALLEAGAPVNMRDKNSKLPIHWAAKWADEKTTRILLQAGAEVDGRAPPNYRTPLHWAARWGNTASAKALIEAGADLNAQSGNEGKTPLQRAARWGHAGMVELLLEAGARIDATDDNGLTALDHSKDGENLQAVNRLLLAATDDTSTTTVAQTVDCGGWNATDLNIIQGFYESLAPQQIHACLESGKTVDGHGEHLMTPLHWAARHSSAESVKTLIQAGARVNASDQTAGTTPLHNAAAWSKLKIIEVLLAAGANTEQQEIRGFTALHIAAIYGTPEAVNLLLVGGADIHAPDHLGSRPLHWAASQDRKELVAALLNAGARTSAVNLQGDTALDLAKREGASEEVIQLLTMTATRPERDDSIDSILGHISNAIFHNTNESLEEQYSKNVKWLAYFKVGAFDVVDLSIYIDLADYFGVTKEGKGTFSAADDGWVTIWIDGGIGFEASVLPVSLGVVKIQFDELEPDPRRRSRLSALKGTALVFSVESFESSEGERSYGNIGLGEIGASASFFNLSRNLLRYEIKRNALDTQLRRAAFDLLMGPAPTSRAVEFFVNALVFRDSDGGVQFNQVNAQDIRPFTSSDDGPVHNLKYADGLIQQIIGGIDANGDGIGDLVFPISSESYSEYVLTSSVLDNEFDTYVKFENIGYNTSDFYVQVNDVPPGWAVLSYEVGADFRSDKFIVRGLHAGQIAQTKWGVGVDAKAAPTATVRFQLYYDGSLPFKTPWLSNELLHEVEVTFRRNDP